ncbi:hypothetical protein PTTG_29248 [Puccinia triticina 1-1 BBBD Race 1]|uniref:Uncharacterized protein n=1 Tax=Puccinia triticina (isolate 1-1 / race 1 (BBBD)) TaxID=630390 RepID=A0A180G5A9_PUCT1|nr:hypothetical protein PTTG_29248 [Puccinia triticina 1-1 BBBD Race 1]WAR54578.1 hypothetical protein PtB15_4B195 [Puccinia triticina]
MKATFFFSIGVAMVLLSFLDLCDARPLIIDPMADVIAAGRLAQAGSRITLGNISYEQFYKAMTLEKEEEMKEMDIYDHKFTRVTPTEQQNSSIS